MDVGTAIAIGSVATGFFGTVIAAILRFTPNKKKDEGGVCAMHSGMESSIYELQRRMTDYDTTLKGILDVLTKLQTDIAVIREMLKKGEFIERAGTNGNG